MTFVSDRLVKQIEDGLKTASVCRLGEADIKESEYDDILVVGEHYDVYDSEYSVRAVIRITGMELFRWGSIPKWLWEGETNEDAEGFREDHIDYFGFTKDNPPDADFEFIGYRFIKTV
jgi:uncharacterized protein YhfF